MPDTKKILTFGALGIGAWWLYKTYESQSAVVDSGAAGGAAPGGGGPSGATPPPPAAPPSTPAQLPAPSTPSVSDAMRLAQESAAALSRGDYVTASRLAVELQKLQQSSQPAPPVAGTRPTSSTLLAYVKDRMGSAFTGKLTADQWNWYYSRVSGIEQTADLFTPGNRSELIDVDTYFSRRSSQGLNGVVSLGIRHPWY